MLLTIRTLSCPPPDNPQSLHAEFDADGGRIGRSSPCKLILPDPNRHISREHAEIRLRDDAFSIKVVSKVNSVLVNDAVVNPGEAVELRDGDQVLIGEYLLRADISQLPAAAAAAARSDVDPAAHRQATLRPVRQPAAGRPPHRRPRRLRTGSSRQRLRLRRRQRRAIRTARRSTTCSIRRPIRHTSRICCRTRRPGDASCCVAPPAAPNDRAGRRLPRAAIRSSGSMRRSIRCRSRRRRAICTTARRSTMRSWRHDPACPSRRRRRPVRPSTTTSLPFCSVISRRRRLSRRPSPRRRRQRRRLSTPHRCYPTWRSGSPRQRRPGR